MFEARHTTANHGGQTFYRSQSLHSEQVAWICAEFLDLIQPNNKWSNSKETHTLSNTFARAQSSPKSVVSFCKLSVAAWRMENTSSWSQPIQRTTSLESNSSSPKCLAIKGICSMIECRILHWPSVANSATEGSSASEIKATLTPEIDDDHFETRQPTE